MPLLTMWHRRIPRVDPYGRLSVGQAVRHACVHKPVWPIYCAIHCMLIDLHGQPRHTLIHVRPAPCARAFARRPVRTSLLGYEYFAGWQPVRRTIFRTRL